MIEEADETVFWLEMIIESNMVKEELVAPLLKEANEIVAIMVSTCKTITDKENRSQIVTHKL